ncbi:uncharacterized protein F4812DRAFT_458402 [Daldinia caldariorum]|uniref:uncharacterized protein n=1 Tax=Daldinia caldariorum TaxID=326644 RepID=UPI0020076894|nr:uncharacterized protein F4812DRAFT_458402 [Daldinia caldariorum]KAI1468875.1 hypothetical protein F4812DRAFT_458402 [Daldinia caldariorum]
MHCFPDPPITQETSSSSQQATTSAPSGPDTLVVAPTTTTPARVTGRATNASPGNPQNKTILNPAVVPVPVTPKNHRVADLSAPEHGSSGSTLSALTPDSVRVRKIASSPDGVVFVDRRGDGRHHRDGRGYASTLESWETAAMFSDLGGIHPDNTPVFSFGDRQDINVNSAGGGGVGVGGGIRSWFAAAEPVEYDLEHQSLLPSTSSAVFAPESHRSDARLRRRRLVDHPAQAPSFWDYMSRTEMAVTCVVLALVILGLVWNVVNLLQSYYT